MPHAFPPAPGYKVEGLHGPSNGPHMLVASGITLGLAIIAMILRMVVKCFIVSSVSWEDYFAIAALLLSVVRTIMLIIMTKNHQFGQHIWDILLPNFGFVYTWAKGATIIYLGAIACAKVSILLLYIRLFGVNRPFRFSCYVLMALVPGYCTAMILANVFQCRPVKAGFNFFAAGHCASLQEITVATGALNIISDIAIVVAPIPLVLKLQLRPAKMVGVLGILATGFLVVAVAAIREVEVVRAPSLYDATWPDATRTLWLSVELNVGIICSCLPILPPLSRKLPGRTYFEDQYHSAISLIRGSRRKSRGSRSPSENIQLGLRESDYIELEKAMVGTESDVGKVRDLVPSPQATINGC